MYVVFGIELMCMDDVIFKRRDIHTSYYRQQYIHLCRRMDWRGLWVFVRRLRILDGLNNLILDVQDFNNAMTMKNKKLTNISETDTGLAIGLTLGTMMRFIDVDANGGTSLIIVQDTFIGPLTMTSLTSCDKLWPAKFTHGLIFEIKFEGDVKLLVRMLVIDKANDWKPDWAINNISFITHREDYDAEYNIHIMRELNNGLHIYFEN